MRSFLRRLGEPPVGHAGSGLAMLPCLALVLLLWAGPAAAQSPTTDAQDFIRGLADETTALLEDDSLSTEQRVREMGDLFNRNFAVDEIAQWVLGRYWRRASPAEQQEYVRLFKDFIVYGYAQRFGDYAGETLRVRDAVPVDGTTAIVRSEIVLGGGQNNVSVDWRVTRGADGRFQIRDVAVEGVSMAQTQRSDFSAAVQRQGGSVAGLNETLRSKIAQLKAELGLTG